MSRNFPELETESDTSLLEPDLQQLRLDRLDRNRAFLQSVNPRVASQVLPSAPCTREDRAATNIQRRWRGYQGRKIYTSKLYDRYLQEEEKQHQKMLYQMEEGELLVENHQLEVLLEDNKTRRRNAARFILSKVIIIQRYWRKYQEKKYHITYQSDSNLEETDDLNHSNSNLATSDTTRSLHDLDPTQVGNQIKSTHISSVDPKLADKDFQSDDETENAFINPLADTGETEPNTAADNEQITEKSEAKDQGINQRLPHETDEQFYRRQRKLSFLAQALEFVQQKKVNTDALPFDLHKLAGAQNKPAAGKEMSEAMTQSDKDLSEADTDVCHCDTNVDSESTGGSESLKQVIETTVGTAMDKVNGDISGSSAHSMDTNPETTAGGTGKHDEVDKDKQDKDKPDKDKPDNDKRDKGDKVVGDKVDKKVEVSSAFDVYNIETTLPNIDWGSLEEKLKAASEEEKRIREARRNDREEIRKKLAMGEDDDYYEDDSNDDIGYKKPNFQSRLHSGLQICFMNESPGDTDSEGRSPRQHEFHDNMKLDPKEEELVDSDNNLRTVQDLNQTASTSATIQNCSPPRLKPLKAEECEGATNFHSRQEQLQNEAKLALAQAGTMAHMQLEIEKQLQKKSPMAEIVGIPGLGERRRKKLSVRQLQEMNLAQIQVLYNDLHTQIENLNEELVHLLMERDELHMEQDSMLVDIEDLTRRAEELAEKGKDVKNNVKGKLPTR